MLIYNVTSKVSWHAQEDWVQWMINHHIPEVLQTGLINRYQLVRLQEVEDIDGPTFAVQYYLENRDHYERYLQEYAPALREKSLSKWGDQVIAFRTLMEVIN
jgi:hypothetical protein